MKTPRRIGYQLYCLYAEIHDFWKRNTDPNWNLDRGKAPCQICGEGGHTEEFCPKAREMWFLNREQDN